MARPKQGTGKTTDFRGELDYLRGKPEFAQQYADAIARVKQIYSETENIGKTAERLGIGKRTLERAMSDIPELQSAINDVRVAFGR